MRTLLVHLYPSSWRRVYGDEFGALLDAMPLTPSILLDLVVAALRARVVAVLRTFGSAAHGAGNDRNSGLFGSSLALRAALFMLVPSIAALVAFGLKFTAGIGGPFDLLWFRVPLALRFAVLVLPFMSLVLVTVPLTSGAVRIESGRLSATLALRLNASSTVVAVISVTLVAALARYFLMRHLLAW